MPIAAGWELDAAHNWEAIALRSPDAFPPSLVSYTLPMLLLLPHLVGMAVLASPPSLLEEVLRHALS